MEYFPIDDNSLPDHPCDFDSLVDRHGTLTITILDDSARISLSFDDYLAFRKRAESDAYLTLDAIAQRSQIGRGLYEVKGSDFIDWLAEQNYHTRDRSLIRHFVVVCADDVIDVLCFAVPKFVSSK